VKCEQLRVRIVLCSNTLAMNPPVDPAAKLARDPGARLRQIPSVDDLLSRPRLMALAEKAGREVVTASVRSALGDLRAQLKSEPEAAEPLQIEALESRIIADAAAALAPSLRRVINATGVILHTNLGRAPLAREAAARMAETVTRYSNLEYDIESGERGKRDVHTAR